MIPRFRLSTPMTRAWAVNREARHKRARWLAHTFNKSGAAVVTDRCFVVAWVNPLAQIKFAVPPFERVERHTCSNNPSWRDCECRRWFDPESAGPWGRRQTPEHHPLCIFDPKSLQRWHEVDMPAKVVRQAIAGGFLREDLDEKSDSRTAELAPPGDSVGADLGRSHRMP